MTKLSTLTEAVASITSGAHLALSGFAITRCTLAVEEYSSLSVAFRYLAGALGIPFIPIRSLRGSDLMAQLKEKSGANLANITDPFTGEDWPVLKPLLPAVAVVQDQVSEEEGNAWIMGPRWDNLEQVRASQRTIVITERIVT